MQNEAAAPRSERPGVPSGVSAIPETAVDRDSGDIGGTTPGFFREEHTSDEEGRR